MRDFQLRIARLDRGDVARDPAKTGRIAMFEPALRQQLHADANAEEGRPSLRTASLEGFGHARRQSRPRRQSAKAPTPGSTIRSARAHNFRIGGDGDRCGEPASRAARSKALAAECRLPEP